MAGSPALIWAISAEQPDLLARARVALEAGLDRLLIREAVLPDLTALEALIGDFPGRVVLHARGWDPQRARDLGAGLHLPSDAGPAGVAGPWGRSCHSPAEVRAAFAAGANWAFLSPIFRPISKPGDERQPLGLEALEGMGAVALGGITAENAGSCLAHGAVGVATMSHILSDPDPAAGVTRWRARLATYQK